MLLDSRDAAESFRLKFLVKKGELNALMADFRDVPKEQKKQVGIELNKLKNLVTGIHQSALEKIEAKEEDSQDHDDSLPGKKRRTGSRHPISIVLKQMTDIFLRMGFTISEGPEIEDDWHNFTAMNTPEDHPARDMQDTFFIEKSDSEDKSGEMALRTHTSSVQVRVMENQQPPIRTISPGRVYRNEAISARAHCFFHQVEGLYIDKDVSFADLKQTLLYFAQEMFGEKSEIRLRPSYFPFTEPSAEVDVSCTICNSKGCNVCKYTGWLEILGCGMVDPNVLSASNIDPEVYSGFAFGMGIERIAQLRYRVNDLRMYSENDIRFLNQFKSAY
mgnify:CR=1 FL=1